MTESDWDSCDDPSRMLSFLRDTGKLSDRKARLFAVACGRRMFHSLDAEHSQAGMNLAEQLADGLATNAARRAAVKLIYADHSLNLAAYVLRDNAVEAARASSSITAYMAANSTVPVRHDGRGGINPAWAAAAAAEASCHAALLRCLFGDPFRPTPALSPLLLNWNNGLIPKLAQQIYDDHAFDRLPLLADALTDAGCDDAQLLEHLHGPGPHARGCAALDVVLGES